MPDPTLAINDFIPRLLPWDFSCGKCSECGPTTLDLQSCPILNNYSRKINCNEWHNSSRPGFSSIGVQKKTVGVKLHQPLGGYEVSDMWV